MAEQEWDYSGSGSNGTVTGSTFGPSSNSCIPIPAYHPSFIHVMQSFVSVTTFLSILGSILIVGTFIAFKNLRTRARQILVQLSIADFAVAASQLVAVNANLKRFAGHVCMGQEQADTNFSSDVFCRVQGGLTIFFTVGSFFWTIAVALFLLTVIVFESQRVGKWLTYISYPVCWGVPAVIVVVFRLRNSIGFHANVDTAWCYVTTSHYHDSAKGHPITASEVFGQVFVYLTFSILLIVYVWIRCAIRFKIRRVSNKASLSYTLKLKAKNADLKLTFIPLVFVLLRMWGAILGVIYIYLPHHSFRETKANAALVLFHAIGSSAQGLANALLFCVFTSTVRKRLARALKQLCCCLCCRKDSEGMHLLEPSDRSYAENTTQYDEEDQVVPKPNLAATDHIQWARRTSTGSGIVSPNPFSSSLENSKYHSVSVGKRVTVGAE